MPPGNESLTVRPNATPAKVKQQRTMNQSERGALPPRHTKLCPDALLLSSPLRAPVAPELRSSSSLLSSPRSGRSRIASHIFPPSGRSRIASHIFSPSGRSRIASHIFPPSGRSRIASHIFLPSGRSRIASHIFSPLLSALPPKPRPALPPKGLNTKSERREASRGPQPVILRFKR